VNHKLKLSLTFLLNEDVSPDMFARRVAETTSALRAGEGIELPSDPSLVVYQTNDQSALAAVRPSMIDQAAKKYTDAVTMHAAAHRRWADAAREAGVNLGTYGGGYKNTKLYRSMVTPYEYAVRDAHNELLHACGWRR
jgi:hypothetical protein